LNLKANSLARAVHVNNFTSSSPALTGA